MVWLSLWNGCDNIDIFQTILSFQRMTILFFLLILIDMSKIVEWTFLFWYLMCSLTYTFSISSYLKMHRIFPMVKKKKMYIPEWRRDITQFFIFPCIGYGRMTIYFLRWRTLFWRRIFQSPEKILIDCLWAFEFSFNLFQKYTKWQVFYIVVFLLFLDNFWAMEHFIFRHFLLKIFVLRFTTLDTDVVPQARLALSCPEKLHFVLVSLKHFLIIIFSNTKTKSKCVLW